jgi:FkbM family methyltransferase
MKSYGDYETDLAIQKYFEPGYIGTCIDVGAGMGTDRSNTYYFEKKYWTCLCIEPNPNLYSHMRMYRRLALNLACSNYDKKSVPFQVYVVNQDNQEAISSLVVDQRLVESHKDIINETYQIEVEVKKLDTILSRINIEKIDFLSIDTEGTELSVLQGLDIKKWNPKLIVVENNFNDPKIKEYLTQFGYILSERLGVNDFYLNSEEKPVTESKKIDLDFIFQV